MSAQDVVMVPLGGVGEIGMNFALYGFGSGRERQWIVVDCGVAFGKTDLPGVDALLPDIQFARKVRKAIAGIVITHAHEDHYGALLDLWPELGAPVYMTPFAAALLAAKRAGTPGAPDLPVTVVGQGERVTVGPFDIEYVPVSHSIPEPNALVLRTPAGTIVHSGDWKLDPEPGLGLPTDGARLQAVGREGVVALVCDSTNAVRDGVSPSEAEVTRTLNKLIAGARQRVIVTTFASNVARLKAVAQAAHDAGRNVVVMGRAMHRSISVADELGYLDGLGPFLDIDDFNALPRDKVVVLCTGSQGESRAMLSRVATGEHRQVAFSPGDLVIFSSRAIPGNEWVINGLINQLVDGGIEVLTDRDALVHTSGHARRDELKTLYGWLRPAAVIPVHGEALHLHEQAKLARASGIETVVEIRNGDLIRVAPGPAEKIDKVASGRLYRDGNLLCTPEDSGVGQRRSLSYAGVVAIGLVIDERGAIAAEPEMNLLGLPASDAEGDTFEDIVADAIDDALDGMPRAKRRDPGAVRDGVRRIVRNEVEAAWGKRTNVAVLVSVVESRR